MIANMSFDVEGFVRENFVKSKIVLQADDCWVMKVETGRPATTYFPSWWLNGYAAVPTDRVKKTAEETEAHGGVTYTNEWKGYTIYGFDTMHALDFDNTNLKNADYVLALAKEMKDDMES
jgi:hypothetical protein